MFSTHHVKCLVVIEFASGLGEGNQTSVLCFSRVRGALPLFEWS